MSARDPWLFDGPLRASEGYVYDDGATVAVALSDGIAGAHERAEYIARAVTAHPRLVEALREAEDWLSSFSMPPTSTIAEKDAALARIRAALASASPDTEEG